ncbi:MAG: hypothetical protein DRJ03_23655 [Chloroflexi bacterium]|nr:MAG: hypothetical protein DRJ03_23655 [Chloroflexota bacterium]
MDERMLEKAKMRVYLKTQINKIKQILELRALQRLCRLKMIVKSLHGGFFPIAHTGNEGTNFLIDLCIHILETYIFKQQLVYAL